MLLLDFCHRRVFLMGAGFKYAKHRVRDIISSDDFRALYLKDCKNDSEAAQRLGGLKTQLDQAGLMD